MVLSLVLVGDEHINGALPYIRPFLREGWKVEILTDQPHKFNSFYSSNVITHQYNQKVFSYFEKLLFPIKITKKYESGVFYVDSTLLATFPKTFIESFEHTDSFLYYKNWPYGEKFKNYMGDIYFTKIVEYFITENYEKYGEIETIMEWVYYMPFNKNKVDQLLYDIEVIKPVFEYSSVIYKPHYSGLGNAEGIALSYVLNKNLIPITKFTNFEFDILTKKPYIKLI